MSFSMSQASLPVFEIGLNALSAVLDKAEAHAAAKKIDSSVLLNSRLAHNGGRDQCRFRKVRFVRNDDAARQGSDTRQCPRIARSDVCTARPSQAKRESAPHYNSWRISQGFAEGAPR